MALIDEFIKLNEERLEEINNAGQTNDYIKGFVAGQRIALELTLKEMRMLKNDWEVLEELNKLKQLVEQR